MAGEALLRHGHRRVAMFLTRRDRWALAYLESMREALRKGGGDVPDEFVYFGGESPTDVKLDERAAGEAVRKMFSRPDRPTGIMCGFDSVAETLYLLLGRLGLRVPEDVSLVGFGGRDRRGAILQRLASVVIDGAETGRRAGELLVRDVRRHPRDRRRRRDRHAHRIQRRRDARPGGVGRARRRFVCGEMTLTVRLRGRKQDDECPENKRFYAGRAAGGDCDHRHFDRAVVARRAGGARGGAADAVQQQREANRVGLAQLPRRASRVSVRLRRSRHRLELVGAHFAVYRMRRHS